MESLHQNLKSYTDVFGRAATVTTITYFILKFSKLFCILKTKSTNGMNPNFQIDFLGWSLALLHSSVLMENAYQYRTFVIVTPLTAIYLFIFALYCTNLGQYLPRLGVTVIMLLLYVLLYALCGNSPNYVNYFAILYIIHVLVIVAIIIKGWIDLMKCGMMCYHGLRQIDTMDNAMIFIWTGFWMLYSLACGQFKYFFTNVVRLTVRIIGITLGIQIKKELRDTREETV